MNYLLHLVQHSVSFQILLWISQVVTQSYSYQIPYRFILYIGAIYQTSATKHYFHTRTLIFTSLLENGFFYRLPETLFRLIDGIVALFVKMVKGSQTEKVVHVFRQDLVFNYVRFLSTFLYTALISYSLLVLLAGSGYNKNQVLVLMVVILTTFSLSSLQGDAHEYLKNSVIIKWIQQIYS